MEIVLTVFFTLLALTIILSIFYILPRLFGATFQSTKKDKVEKMVLLADPKPNDIAVDLGSGDGRLVEALAKKGIEAHGFEINPLLVLYSRYRLRKLKNAKIYWKNFWTADLSRYNIIMFFQTGKVMPALKKKIQKESSKSKVVSYYWRFPKQKPLDFIEDVYLYKL
jgi:16S rRNA A1518/A1519 N6-dimethyltransferase RsmA/KsgA/DIM1 with predicted DNA glycosylase/AP lyase activity